jgi:hypothetical protein
MANQKCTLMIDSGADISLFKCTKIPDTQIIYPQEACSIQGVTQNKTTSIGPTFTKLHINEDTVLEHKFQLVSEKFPIHTDGILGRDFLQKYKCIIDYDSFLLTINCEKPHSIPILDQLQPGQIVIPARSEVIRRISSDFFLEPQVILAQEVERGVFCCNTIINETAYLKFVNTNTHDVKITNFKPEMISASEYTILNYNTTNIVKAKRVDQSRIERLLKEVDLSEVPAFAQDSIKNICTDFNDIFALSTDKLTVNNFYEQEIRLVNENPSYVKNYRIPHHQKTIINSQVQDMIENDVVEPSRSPYNSPLLLVPKKGSKDKAEWRLVIDYRNINKKVIGDKFPLPRIEEILDQLGRAKYFSILDLKSGYHQIPIATNSRECTAFSTDQGHFQFKRLPFGLKISGNSFQRMMTISMAGLTPEVAFLYVDDLVVFGCSPEHHNKNLIKVFERLERYNLKLNPKKCAFMQPSVTYLGHVISDQGISPDPSKFEILLNYPVPENADEVRRFVAFCNYYRRFVPNFADLAQPLNSLLRKDSTFKWDKKCQNAFETLKHKLVQPPILQYPDFHKEFKLTTDASDIACGAILSQEVDGKDLPIAYASKAFNKGEKNKSTILKELTAIHWAVTFFKPYLFGKKFTIFTDHKPLIYLFSMKNPTSKLTRIRWDLEEFEYDVKYITGKTNAGADALSRIILNSNTLEDMSILAIQTRSCTRKNLENPLTKTTLIPLPKSFDAVSPNEIKNLPELIFIIEEKSINNKKNEKYNEKLKNDIVIKIKKELIIKNPAEILELTLALVEEKSLERPVIKLKLNKNNQIFSHVTTENFKAKANKVLKNVNIILYDEPRTLTDKTQIENIMHDYHNSPIGGHNGVTRMLKRLRRKYYWDKMKHTVIEMVKKCTKCKANKHSKRIKEPMTLTTTPSNSLEILSLDTIGPFTRTERGNRYALTIQDELTKYIRIVPIPDKEAETLARAFVEGFILNFGIPKYIKTDMGTEYLNKVFNETCKLLEINQLHSVAYHPETLGSLERNHRCLNEYIRAYVNENKDDWDQWTKYYEFSYNTTPSVAHDYAPFELMFGKTPYLPIDFQENTMQPLYNIDNFAQETKFRIHQACIHAKRLLLNAKEKSKVAYDITANKSNLKHGDKVMLQKENRRKLDPVYTGPFEIIRIKNPNSVIQCQITGKTQEVHNNRLKSIG